MGKHRAFAASEDGGEHVPLSADCEMADCERATKEGLEVSGPRPIAYFVVTKPERSQLSARNHPMLFTGDTRNREA